MIRQTLSGGRHLGILCNHFRFMPQLGQPSSRSSKAANFAYPRSKYILTSAILERGLSVHTVELSFYKFLELGCEHPRRLLHILCIVRIMLSQP